MAAMDLLSDKTIKSVLSEVAKTGKPRKLNDGGGLVLDARPNGSGWWRWRFWRDGREGMLSLGVYPEITLKVARQRRDEARRQAALGTDPSAGRKKAKADRALQQEAKALAAAGLPGPGTFEHVARRWYSIRSPEWAPKYASKVIARLEGKAFPYIGTRQIADITPPELLKVLRRCEDDGFIETAHRVRDTCSEVFRFAVSEGLIDSDPARDLARALRKHTTKHIASITDPQRFGDLLRAIAAYRGTSMVRAALGLLALLFTRPGEELRRARWEEFDLEAAVWSVPASRMKRTKYGKENGPDHVVPLSDQSIAILRDLRLLTGNGDYLFPGRRDRTKPISENTLNAALDSMGFGPDEHRAHGFRASARTMLAERLHLDVAAIEAQLAHSVPDALGRSYNRTKYLDDRRKVMVVWADYLDRLRGGADVIEMRRTA